MMTRRLALAATAATTFAGAGRADPTVRWSIATEYPATAIPGEGVAAFASAAERLSKGALTVQPGFDAPGGLRSQTMPAAVAAGSPEAGDSFAAMMSAVSPIFELSGLPFLTASAEDASRLLKLARPAYEAALTKAGLELLYATPWPPSGLWSRQAVGSPADLAGLRVRTYDAASAEVLNAAGAKAERISFTDALQRLKAGTLDAVLSSGDGGAGARLWETLPHFTVLNYAFPLSLAYCSAKALSALPAGVADAVRQAGVETETRQFAAMANRVRDNEARMRDNGVAMSAAPAVRRALSERAAPVIARWEEQAGDTGRSLLGRYRAG